jgi:c-di-GMP-binding flagellar brake protein YcgR
MLHLNDAEKRKQERYSLECYLKVMDTDRRSLLGHIVDISMGGMKLLSEQPIRPDETYRLLLDLSLGSHKQTKVLVEARSVWTGEDANPRFYSTGFCFQGLSGQAQIAIMNLVTLLGREGIVRWARRALKQKASA